MITDLIIFDPIFHEIKFLIMILNISLKNFLKCNLDRKICLLFFEYIIFLRFFLRIKKKKANIWQVYFRIKKKTKKFKKTRKIIKFAICSSQFSQNILLEYVKNYEFFIQEDLFFYSKKNALRKKIWLYLMYMENFFKQKDDLLDNYIKSSLFFFKKKSLFWQLLFLKFGPDVLLVYGKKNSFFFIKNSFFLFLFYYGKKKENISDFSKKLQIINKYSIFFLDFFPQFEKKTLFALNECIVLVLNFIHKKKILSFLKNICAAEKTRKRKNIIIFFQNGEILFDESDLLLKNHIFWIKLHDPKNHTKTDLIQKNLFCIRERKYIGKKQDYRFLNYFSGRVDYKRFGFQKNREKIFPPIFFPNFFFKIKSSIIHLEELEKKSFSFAFSEKTLRSNFHLNFTQNDGYIEKKKEFYQNFREKKKKCKIKIKEIILRKHMEDNQSLLFPSKRNFSQNLMKFVILFQK